MKNPLSAQVVLWARALRLNQWTKNLVVGVSVFFAWWDPSQSLSATHLWSGLAAMGLFCLVSSGVYLGNDLVDRASDRAHPVKKHRPVASGAIGPGSAALLSALLLAGGAAAGFALSPRFGAVLAGYIALQAAYTLLLKQVPLLDVFLIAAGFVLRAMGGAVAVNALISPWLLLCAFLLALFLALCKRRHEKLLSEADEPSPLSPAPLPATRRSLAAYDVRLLDSLIAIAAASTIVGYSIYTLTESTVAKFGTHGLGFTIPFVMFGIFRYLDLVYRHDMGDRPEKVLLTDKPLLADIVLYGLCATLVLAAAARAS